MVGLARVGKMGRMAQRGVGLSILCLCGMAALPGAVFAHERSYRMPDEICDILREVPLNRNLLNQILRRPDYLDILEYADEHCGDLSGLMIGATGAIPVAFAVGDRDGRGTGTSGGPSTGGGGTDTGGGTGTGGGTDTGGGTGTCVGTGTDCGTGTGNGNGSTSSDSGYGNGQSTSENGND